MIDPCPFHLENKPVLPFESRQCRPRHFRDRGNFRPQLRVIQQIDHVRKVRVSKETEQASVGGRLLKRLTSANHGVSSRRKFSSQIPFILSPVRFEEWFSAPEQDI